MNSNFPLFNSLSVFSETFDYLKKADQQDVKLDQLKIEWAQTILKRLNVFCDIQGNPSSQESLLVVGNHVSYLDIPVLMSCMPNISFVAKSEIAKWPIFGAAAKKVDTVFVKRESGQSRLQVRNTIQGAIENGKRIVVFPSGTTSMFEKNPWKRGVFQIAHQAKCKIQPFRLTYNPNRSAAYIDRDFFPVHLYKLSRIGRVDVTLEFHDPVSVEDPDWSRIFWHTWAQGGALHAPN